MTHRKAAVSTRTPQPILLKHLPELDIAARYQPARIGGDFFDAVMLDRRVTILLTDIAGDRNHAHPVAAAIQEVFRTCSTSIFGTGHVNESEGTAALLHEINRTLLNGSGGIRFAPTFLGCYNLQFSILTYINAGAVSPLFRDSDGTRILDSGGVPLGLFSHLTHEPSIQTFEPGARMLLMTKGLIHGSSEGSGNRSEVAMVRMRRVFEDPGLQTANEICKAILREGQVLWQPRRFARLRKSEDLKDLTVVALVRPA